MGASLAGDRPVGAGRRRGPTSRLRRLTRYVCNRRLRWRRAVTAGEPGGCSRAAAARRHRSAGDRAARACPAAHAAAGPAPVHRGRARLRRRPRPARSAPGGALLRQGGGGQGTGAAERQLARGGGSAAAVRPRSRLSGAAAARAAELGVRSRSRSPTAAATPPPSRSPHEPARLALAAARREHPARPGHVGDRGAGDCRRSS